MADPVPVPTPEPAPVATAPIANPCPRCGLQKRLATDIVCPTCWQLVPKKLRRSWGGELVRFSQRNWAGQAIWKWANPEGAPPAADPAASAPPVRKEARGFRCARCGAACPKPSRGALAQALLEVLLAGEVQHRVAFIAARLNGLCEACAAAPPPAPGDAQGEVDA